MTRRAGGGHNPGWYFDEAGDLAASAPGGRAARLQEWLGLAYGAAALALGAPAWFAGSRRAASRRRAEAGSATSTGR
jgi:hypothetical protein